MTSQNGSILPSPDILNNLEYGKFVLSNLAAKRAKQLRDGAPPLVKIDSNHPLSIALAEIAAGKIKPGPIVEPDLAVEADLGMPIAGVGSELGILLPALDEAEAEILGVSALMGDDIEEDHHDEEGIGSLSDLLEDEADVVVEADDDTLSLSEVAEQEESAADDAEEPAV